MINVLLCAEGVTDQGGTDYNVKQGHTIQNDGPIQILIRKIANRESSGAECKFTVRTRKDIDKITLLGKERPKLDKDAPPAKLYKAARINECTHIAYHRDEDHRGLDDIRTEVDKNFTKSKDCGLHCLIIVPQRMIESWLLSDKNAYKDDTQLPSKPEEIWGDKGSFNHPKKWIERALKAMFMEPSAKTYAYIAENSDIDVIRQKCPESFGKYFFDEVIKWLAASGSPQSSSPNM